MGRGFRTQLAEAIGQAEVVDTHEHLRLLKALRQGIGFTGLLRHTYLTRSLRDPDESGNGLSESYARHMTEETWEVAQAAIDRVRLSSYCHWPPGLRELYDLRAAIA
ncbi:MAG: hypothetical protein ACYDCI_02045 [Candidatus Limnocylindrales bacterium]